MKTEDLERFYTDMRPLFVRGKKSGEDEPVYEALEGVAATASGTAAASDAATASDAAVAGNATVASEAAASGPAPLKAAEIVLPQGYLLIPPSHTSVAQAKEDRRLARLVNLKGWLVWLVLGVAAVLIANVVFQVYTHPEMGFADWVDYIVTLGKGQK